MRTVSEGLPLNWQELSYQDDIIAGAEFLSIFLRSRLQDTQMATEDRTTLQTILDSGNDLIEYPKKELLRHSRSTSLSQPHTATPPVTDQSSEGTTTTAISTETTTEIYRAIVSEERPSLFADVNKSEFSVDEGEPIARTAATEAMSDPNASPLYSSAQGSVNQQNFVYHNYPENDEGGRSVSYSRVVQELPQQTIVSSWNIEKPLGGDYKAVTKSNTYDIDKTATVDVNKTSISTTTNYFSEEPPVEDQENMMVPQKNNWQLQKNVYPPSRRPVVYGKPEQNYEVDESVSIMTNGRTHGVQQDGKAAPPALTNQSVDDSVDPNGQKVGYVVEGRNFRKYRVEERTSDGFIVGEYGVVSHNDGSLRGVRYTADSTINPRVIYDALMKFLSL